MQRMTGQVHLQLCPCMALTQWRPSLWVEGAACLRFPLLEHIRLSCVSESLVGGQTVAPKPLSDSLGPGWARGSVLVASSPAMRLLLGWNRWPKVTSVSSDASLCPRRTTCGPVEETCEVLAWGLTPLKCWREWGPPLQTPSQGGVPFYDHTGCDVFFVHFLCPISLLHCCGPGRPGPRRGIQEGEYASRHPLEEAAGGEGATSSSPLLRPGSLGAGIVSQQ